MQPLSGPRFSQKPNSFFAPRARPVSGVFPFNRDIWIFFLLKAKRICAQFFPICLSLRCQLASRASAAGLTLLKKYVIILKKRHFFPKVKRSALNYHKMELQLNTVPPKVILQGAYVPIDKEVAARRLSVAQTGTEKCRFDFFKNLCYNRIDTLKIFRHMLCRPGQRDP